MVRFAGKTLVRGHMVVAEGAPARGVLRLQHQL
jgi:hypothetical protein